MDGPSEEEIAELFEVHNGPIATAERAQRAANLDDTRTWVDPNGYRLSDRLWQGKERVRNEINDVLRKGLANGTDALELADILEDYLNPEFIPKRDNELKMLPRQKKSIVTDYPGRGGQGSYSARRLAITEITRAHGQATLWAAERTPFSKGVKWNLSPSHPKRDRCNEHAAKDSGLGRGVYPVADAPRYPDHPFCVPPGTVIQSPPIQASMQRWFDGELVEIVTTGGNRLSVTPNHPILTDRGWVAAALVDPGDHVISGILGQGVAVDVGPDHDNRPTLIEDVAVTLGGSLPVTAMRVPTTAEDFHGDGSGGDVCVVRTNGLLQRAVDAASQEPELQQDLVRGNSAAAFFSADGDLALRLKRSGDASAGFVGVGSVPLVLFGTPGGHADSVGLSDRPSLNSGPVQSQGDRRTRDTERVGDRLLGFSGEVSANDVFDWHGEIRDAGCSAFRDRVLRVEMNRFSGHVYNLQTETGWYIANGIITHNCRCFLTTEVEQDDEKIVEELRHQFGLD